MGNRFKPVPGMRVISADGFRGNIVEVHADSILLKNLKGYQLSQGEAPEFSCPMDAEGYHDGSAFTIDDEVDVDPVAKLKMMARKLGEQPIHGTVYEDQGLKVSAGGLTRREHFAAMNMASIVGDGGNGSASTQDMPHYAKIALAAADALLEELSK